MTAPLQQPSATLPQPDFPGYNAISAATAESLDPNFRPNQVDSFDFTIQRQLSRKVTLELGYIGRRITHEYLPHQPERGANYDDAWAGNSSPRPIRMWCCNTAAA